MLKTILGYDIVEGVSAEEYERWLFEVHAPDLLANPHIDRIIFNKVLRPVTQSSGGASEVPPGESFYRIAEMHFADEEAYARYLEWFEQHPLDPSRGPGGRTDFKFYLVTESAEVNRDTLSQLGGSPPGPVPTNGTALGNRGYCDRDPLGEAGRECWN